LPYALWARVSTTVDPSILLAMRQTVRDGPANAFNRVSIGNKQLQISGQRHNDR